MNSELNIIMVPTTKCNLSCRYCFEEHTDREMSQAELDVVMGKVREYCQQKGFRSLNLYWQGGEVLTLGTDWFKSMGDIVAQKFAGSHVHVQHRMQSNLISYNTRWRPVIETIFHNSIGSSLDYPSLYRGFQTVHGDEFNEVWLKYCNRARADGIEVSVISVLNEASIKMPPEEYLEFYSDRMGLTNMQINFPFSTQANENMKASFFLDPEEMGKFLADLFTTWVNPKDSWYSKIRINPFGELIDVFSLAPRQSRCNCIWSGNCADSFFSIGPDSSVGLCDCWVTSLPDFMFGNLQTDSFDELIDSHSRQRLRNRIDWVLANECADCDYLGICFGGCIIRTFGATGVIEQKDPYCIAYKTLFSTVQEYTRSLDSTGGVQ